METEQTLTLRQGDRTGLDNGIYLTYSSFGHEHVSYGPDESFAATIAVYVVTVESNDSTEDIYFYRDIRSDEDLPEKTWATYRFRLMPESTQDILVLRCMGIKTDIPQNPDHY